MRRNFVIYWVTDGKVSDISIEKVQKLSSLEVITRKFENFGLIMRVQS